MSGWSGWTPSPSTDVHGSDFGDMNIDVHTLPDFSPESTGEQDPTPFAFTKTQVGKRLYDPKDLSFLGAIGGLEGLSLGLQVDLNNGLSPDEDILDVPITLEDVWRTLSHGEIIHGIESRGAQNSTHFRDRRRVFGENKIPVRRPKNILELMWVTLQDKVLVESTRCLTDFLRYF
jgi:P-type Ca2+ transporter type 2C